MMNRIAKTVCIAFAALALGAFADSSAPFSVDGRGLVTLTGILRDNSKVEWGFVNFVAFGPGWQFTAQDYAVKDKKKESVKDEKFGDGLLFTGKIWAGSRGLNIREEFYNVSPAGGPAKAHVRWTISSIDGKAMGLERAYIRFPLSRAEFAGGSTSAGEMLPAEFAGKEWISACKDKSDVRIMTADGKKTLALSVASGSVVVQDARKDKQDRYELRVEFPNAKGATSATIEFDVWGTIKDGKKDVAKVDLTAPKPPAKVEAGEGWCVFPWTNEVKPGSILDFTDCAERKPAGSSGFVQATKDGHFVFEKSPRKPVRFVGGNLCFDANFLSKEEADKAVTDFKVRGWNTIRFHHIDVTITKNEWNGIWDANFKKYPEIDPAKLDKLDYLLAACKKAGIYITFDLYAMGHLGSCEGFDKPLNSNTVKAIVPIHKPAEDQWFKRAMEMFNHINPYTGVAWKDEPAILFCTLINEDSIASVWWGAADQYIAKYAEWAKAKGYPQYERKKLGGTKEFAEFLYEVKAKANARMGQRLKDAGVRALISGGNWWNNKAQTYERQELDVVDNHQYADHPQPSYQKLPFHVNQTTDLTANPTYVTPIMMGPTRVVGKPFTVTEYNFCPPNKWRGQGGLLMGAYASLQDWDGLYRFGWSHSKANMFAPNPVKGFDIVTDPVGQLTERQIVLLFGRRDVKPGEKLYGYEVSKADAFEGGLGDMWSKNLFPHAFTQLGYLSRIGSFTRESGRPNLEFAGVYDAKSRDGIAKFPKRGVSDTGEIAIDMTVGHLTVKTPRTAAVAAVDKGDVKAGPLAVKGATVSCAVSASSMDGADLAKSKRILVFHITDILNTDIQFGDDASRDLQSWGKLPYLARTGSASITLENANKGLTVWALASDGTRLRKVPATYANGAYTFTAAVVKGEGKDAPTMIYELAN